MYALFHSNLDTINTIAAKAIFRANTFTIFLANTFNSWIIKANNISVGQFHHQTVIIDNITEHLYAFSCIR